MSRDDNIILGIIVGIITLLIILGCTFIIHYGIEKTKQSHCDKMSITDAWNDEYCRNYFLEEASKNE